MEAPGRHIQGLKPKSESSAQEQGLSSWGRLVRHVLVLCTGSSAAQLLMIGSSPILTRLFLPEQFAAFGFHQAALTILTLLLTLQFEGAIPIPQSARQSRLLLQLAVATAASLSLLCLLLSTLWIALGQPGLTWLPATVLLLVPICAGAEALARCYRLCNIRDGRFAEMSLIRVSQTAVTVPVQLICGWFGWLQLGLAGGDAVGRWIAAGYAAAIDRARLREQPVQSSITESPASWRDYWQVAVEFRRFPLLVSPGVLLAASANLLPALVLPNLHGPQFAGQFALANRSVLMPLLLISQAVTAVYVSNSSRLVRERSPALSQLIRQTAWQMAGLGLLLTLTAACSGPLLFPWIFGQNWVTAGQLVPYLAVAGFAQFVGGPVNQVLVLLGGELRKFGMNCVAAGAVVTTFLLAWQFHWSPFATTAAYVLTILAVQGLYLWQSILMVDQQVRLWNREHDSAGGTTSGPALSAADYTQQAA
jgi:O-antigen/teichoic acid export membrane protein